MRSGLGQESVPCCTFPVFSRGRAASAGCGDWLVCSDPVMGCELWDQRLYTLMSLPWHHAVNSDATWDPASSASGKLVWQSTDVLELCEWPQIPSSTAGNTSQQRVYDPSDVNKYLGHCWGRNEDDDMQDCQVTGVITGSVYSGQRVVCTALYDYDLHPVNTDSTWRQRW